MKKTPEERLKSKCIRFGRKNRLCGILVMPVLFFGLFFLHVVRALLGNTKRLSMTAMACCLFTVFSSFSFPLFISGNEQRSLYDELGASEMEVTLAREEEFDLAQLELLEDEDVIEEDEYDEASHGMAIIDKYEADEILVSLQERVSDADAERETESGREGETPEFAADDWRLVLINKQHSIPEDYSFTFGTINTLKGKMQCDERIIEDLSAMLTAAKAEEVSLLICSPYRDLEYQKMLFNRKIDRYMRKGLSYVEAYRLSSQVVTVPGASEHQIGLALDIVCNNYTNLDEGFGDTAAGKWLSENSYKYGFILRYPKGKEAITGIDYEPWHFRYVGADAAAVITQEGLTLEEFWEEYL